ncbi:MAG: response regulator [Terracidiphilus sp.]|jgi:DNA-binding response OmpR family regulator
MKEKILIVEDEPIIALDLQQELEQFGWSVTGIAESADEALMEAEQSQPDLALMDLQILGALDGIQTAKLLRDAYRIPSIFLTALSDDATIARATRAMPYGYLAKPFRTRELKATVLVALHKARADGRLFREHGNLTSSVEGMHEALLAVSRDGRIQFMNAAAERLVGVPREFAFDCHFREVVDLRDAHNREIPIATRNRLSRPVEESGASLHREGQAASLVDLIISPCFDDPTFQNGFILTLRPAEGRVRFQELREDINVLDEFELAPTAMMQLDSTGHVVRANQALLWEAGVGVERLLGRTLTSLTLDPDPRISGKLMHRLLLGGDN